MPATPSVLPAVSHVLFQGLRVLSIHALTSYLRIQCHWIIEGSTTVIAINGSSLRTQCLHNFMVLVRSSGFLTLLIDVASLPHQTMYGTPLTNRRVDWSFEKSNCQFPKKQPLDPACQMVVPNHHIPYLAQGYINVLQKKLKFYMNYFLTIRLYKLSNMLYHIYLY